jgi:hypothetical protein
MGRVSAEKRRAAVERLSRLREDEALTAAHVRTVAEGLHVAERTVWRWLAPPKSAAPAVRPRYELSDTDRAALAFYRGNVAAVVRARQAPARSARRQPAHAINKSGDRVLQGYGRVGEQAGLGLGEDASADQALELVAGALVVLRGDVESAGVRQPGSRPPPGLAARGRSPVAVICPAVLAAAVPGPCRARLQDSMKPDAAAS